MKTSENGLNLIKSFEGCRLDAYTDPAGVLTIGYGHTSGVKKGQKITQSQADAFLKEDVERFEKSVNALLIHYKFNQNEFDALVSFTYNLGAGNLKKLTNNNKRNKGQIADAMLLYNKAGGQVLKGLVKRRQAERQLFCTPVGSVVTTPTPTTTTNATTKKTSEEIAREVIAGKWGNGAERKKKLTDAGYNPTTIQRYVNKLLKK